MDITHTLLIIIRWALLVFVLAVSLFLIAGKVHLWTLDVYLVVLASSLLAMMLAIAPQINHDQKQAGDGGGSDGAIRFALVALFFLTLAVAAFDVGRLHLSNTVPVVLSVLGLLMFVGASGFQAWAMSVNSFYSPIIHIQAERGHRVVTRGPYRILRHPAYFANIIAVPASALAIGSWVGLFPAAACCALTIWRARKEDFFLRQHLAGYGEYMKEVRGGVIPHLSLKR